MISIFVVGFFSVHWLITGGPFLQVDSRPSCYRKLTTKSRWFWHFRGCLWFINVSQVGFYLPGMISKAPAFHLLIEAKREHLRLHSRFANFASPVFIAESTMLWGAARQARKARTLLLPLKVVSPCWVSLPNPGSIGLHALHILTSKRMWRNARQKDLEEKKVRVLHFMSIRNVLAVLCRI